MTQTLSISDAAWSAPHLFFVPAGQELPSWISRQELATFLHEHMKPYEDTLVDVRRGLDDALGNRPGPGGFVVLARLGTQLTGALVMLGTGMRGYIPEHLLLFVAVDRSLRNRGIGELLVRAAEKRCDGDIKLHVEHDNPAKRLYERLGFVSKYADMRLRKKVPK
ncbi:MAG: GNAT family N-acetyltransferase [Deltaproteobacteria bacterium]|nr:GNAT family N-acetyltransferase [Deltaproteobacteria bacterium]